MLLSIDFSKFGTLQENDPVRALGKSDGGPTWVPACDSWMCQNLVRFCHTCTSFTSTYTYVERALAPINNFACTYFKCQCNIIINTYCRLHSSDSSQVHIYRWSLCIQCWRQDISHWTDTVS